MTKRITKEIFLVLLLTAISAACDVSLQARPYEVDAFTFTIPAGWKTMDEIWKRTPSPGNDYYRLGLQEQVMIQYPPRAGQGNVFFAVASSPLGEGEDLQSRFTATYAELVPEIRDISQGPIELNGLSGYQITYQRAWGEPWWNFRDIWIEKDGVIYVLSFHAFPASFESNNETFDQILADFQFK